MFTNDVNSFAKLARDLTRLLASLRPTPRLTRDIDELIEAFETAVNDLKVLRDHVRNQLANAKVK